MAQTKTRGSGKGSSASARSRPGTRKSQSSSKSRSTKPRQQKPKQQKRKRKQSTAQRSSPSSSSSNGLRDVPQTVEQTGKKVARNVGDAASKAKTPLLAGSAALAGAAGGLAIGAMRSRHSAASKAMPKPLQAKRIRVSSRDVAKVARRIGTVSRHVADLTGEMSDGDADRANGRRKSPLEVVLDGLTTRR